MYFQGKDRAFEMRGRYLQTLFDFMMKKDHPCHSIPAGQIVRR